MATIDNPPARIPRKPYTPDKEKGAKAMTIAIGMLCKDGLVLAADRQFTLTGYFKYSKEKFSLHEKGLMDFAFVFSGDPGTAKEVEQRIFEQINQVEEQDINLESVRQIADHVLSDMGRLQNTFEGSLQFLLGMTEFTGNPRLLIFNGRALHEVTEGTEILGCGSNTSLITFLKDQLYTQDITKVAGKALAAYLVKKATQYVDACGEPIDVMVLDDWGVESVSKEEIAEDIRKIEDKEEFLSTLLIQTPFSSPNAP